MSLIILFTLILAFLKLTKRFVVLFNHCQGSPLRAIFVTLKDYVPIKCAHVEVLHVFSTLLPPPPNIFIKNRKSLLKDS